ncbi:MAG: YfcC family protein, partial [Marivirga sp.]|nr:YfcC family protein [Marivirga sp.]
IVVVFILVAGILTYIIPKGKYDRIVDPETKRETVVPGSYKRAEAENMSPFEILVCIPRGIINGGEVVVLILLVGGCLFIVEKTGALKEGVASLTSKVKGKEEFALVMIAFLFALGGATEGLQEEIIPLIPVLLVFTRNLGYPPIVTVAISYGAASIGSTFSPVNPFGVVIAQKIAEVPFLTGSLFRLIIFVIAFALWMTLVIRYANKNKVAKESTSLTEYNLSNTHIAILVLTLLAFVLLIYGMLSWGWGFNEISAEFFVMGILIGIVGGLGTNGTFAAYAEGLKEMTFAAVIVGMTYGISLVLKEGLIIDSIIYGLFTPLQYVPTMISAFGMMVSQALLHVALPSYSGQAVLTIPILAPLSDLIGLSRNVCIMAYQYGAILMDLIIPTNGALMAIITIAGISYRDWLNFVVKRLLILFLFSLVSMGIAIALGQ